MTTTTDLRCAQPKCRRRAGPDGGCPDHPTRKSRPHTPDGRGATIDFGRLTAPPQRGTRTSPGHRVAGRFGAYIGECQYHCDPTSAEWRACRRSTLV